MAFAEASNNGSTLLPFLVLNAELLFKPTSNMKCQTAFGLRAHDSTPITRTANITHLRPPLPGNLGAIDPLPPFRVPEEHLWHQHRAYDVGPTLVRGPFHRTLLHGAQAARTRGETTLTPVFIILETTPFAEPVSFWDTL